MLKTTRSAPRHPNGSPAATRAGGFTLIEVGLAIALLGVIVLMVAEFYVNQVNLGRESRRVSGTVLDMHTIIDASVLWQEAYGFWPNDAVTDVIGVPPLVAQGFLSDATLPRNRYIECVDCAEYAILGWDRDAGPGALGDYTTRATEADDLVVRAEVPRLADAWTIAGQLPQGHVVGLGLGLGQGQGQGQGQGTPPTPPFVVESRIYTGEASVAEGDFVRIRDEDRAVVFHPYQEAFNVQGADLQRVGRIAGSEQPPRCAFGESSDSGACQIPRGERVAYGSTILFQEPVCGAGQSPLTHNCRRVCASFESPRTDNCQVPELFSDGPTILLREGLPFCEPGVTTNCWAPRTIGPTVVLHGLEEAPLCRDEQERNCDKRPLCRPGLSPPNCRPKGPIVHLLTASEKVLIEGDLEILANDGRSGQVVLQSDLNEFICCVRTATTAFPPNYICNNLPASSARRLAIDQCLATL